MDVPASFAPPPRRAQILLVEDHEDIIPVVEQILTEEGYQVVTATTLRQAMDRLRGESFDLMLVDSLAETLANALKQAARLREQAPATPMVLFTAHVVHEATARAAGFAGAISKPFDIDQLVAQVGAFVRR